MAEIELVAENEENVRLKALLDRAYWAIGELIVDVGDAEESPYLELWHEIGRGLGYNWHPDS